MNLFILDSEKLVKYQLPTKVEEDYSISYKPFGHTNTFLITLEARDGNWIIKSNGSVNVMNNEMIMEESFLQKYYIYPLKMVGINRLIYVYVMPAENDCIFRLSLDKINQITVGNAANNISYNNPALGDFQLVLNKKENNWELDLVNVKFAVYINNNLLKTKNRVLKYGDVIFIYGLKIIIMKDFIEINNPNNQVGVNAMFAYNDGDDNTNYQEVSEEDKNVDLYSEDDYFFHTPTIKEVLEEQEIHIDTPPANQNEKSNSALMTIGMSITMVSSTIMMGYNVFNQIFSGTSTIKQALPQIIMLVAMLIGTLLIPTIVRRLDNHKKKNLEKKRQVLFSKYLEEKEKEITATIANQKNIVNTNSPTAEQCKEIITKKGRLFWSRELSDNDFLDIRLGIGTIKSKVKIEAAEKHFELVTDNLMQKVYDLGEKYKMTSDFPICINLANKKVSAIVCSGTEKQSYSDSIIMQLIALHSPIDLKLCFITNEDNYSNWEYARMLPHSWNATKDTRFFATNIDEAKELSEKLEEVYKLRRDGDKNKSENQPEEKKVEEGKEYRKYEDYYLLIIDDFKTAKNLQIINDIQNSQTNYGFSILYIGNNLKQLPAACTSFIEIGSVDGAYLEKSMSSDNQLSFKIETFDNQNMMDYSIVTSNIPTITKNGAMELPQSISFLEMYGVSKIEQLNISNRWKNDSPVNTLATSIGVQEDGELFKLNLHEKYHGPHGLIAGSTGSGKSEFIITYILSMAVNYHPYEVQFVLIDYKGGGLAGAFENKETGVVLPHLTGTITNLDVAEMNRTLVSIKSELQRRQRVFNETKDKLGKSTIDIYKYQKYYRDGLIEEPMSHLFIISDEFAELKQQQPEFMDELISIARIGRSLGVHLILATQKPSGVVNDQIWSNSKFKVCLKVQSRSDSMEMIKRPEAASIKEAGRFYLQVGYDDLFQLGQSAWAGAKYIPSDKILKKVDDSINFISHTGEKYKNAEDIVAVDTTQDYGDQLTNIVKYICDLGKKEEVLTSKLWLDAIPEKIFVQNLKTKYNYNLEPYRITPVIGEYDDPANQRQGIATLNISDGNSLIYGISGSGKENLLTTMIYSTITEHKPEEVNFYIIDCGAETLKIYNKIPHVGAVATTGEAEKIYGIFDYISGEIERRRNLFADFGGSYKEYIANSEEKLPLLVIVINYYDTFDENYGKLADSLTTLYRDGNKYGVMFVITANSSSSLTSRARQHFTNFITLKLSDDTKYMDAIDAPKGLIPSNFFGRGLIKIDKSVFEFQTAQFVERNQIVQNIRQLTEQMKNAYTYKAKVINVLPNEVNISLFNNTEKSLDRIPIGYSENNKEPYFYNFTVNKINSIIANEMDSDKINFIFALIKLLSSVENTQITLLDFAKMYDRQAENVKVINDDYNNGVVEINNDFIKDKDNNIKNICIVLGIGQINDKLSESGRGVLGHFIENINAIPNASIILIDTYYSYKNIQLENWYMTNIDKSYGIWLGNDVGSQVAINITNLSTEDRENNFPQIGFAVSKGNKETIKFVMDKGDEEKNEEQSTSSN